jgi:hypothetical protein
MMMIRLQHAAAQFPLVVSSKAVWCALGVMAALPMGLRGYAPAPRTDERIVQLTQRIAALEGELAALQSAPSRVQAPFQVVDSAGRTILAIESVADGGAAVTVGSMSGGGLRLGVGSSGAGFLNLRRSDGVIAASIGQYKGGPTGVQVFDAEGAGAEPVAQITAGANDKGELVVGRGDSGGVTLASGASEAGVLKVRRSDGTVGTSIGQYKGGPMGVQVFTDKGAGADPIVELTGDASGGGRLTVTDAAAKPILRVAEQASTTAFVNIAKQDNRYHVSVANAAGTRLASIGEANNGAGGVWAFGTDGKMRALLNGLTGEIHVLDGGGISRATMAVGSNGAAAISLRAASNTTVARLGEGQLGGWLQLANSSGYATVEAGTHPKGVGLIRAFPVGSPGGGMVGMPGTFLLGRIGS